VVRNAAPTLRCVAQCRCGADDDRGTAQQSGPEIEGAGITVPRRPASGEVVSDRGQCRVRHEDAASVRRREHARQVRWTCEDGKIGTGTNRMSQHGLEIDGTEGHRILVRTRRERSELKPALWGRLPREGATRFQYRQQYRGEVDSVIHRHKQMRAALEPGIAQAPCHPVGANVQFAIGEAVAFVFQRRDIAARRRMPFDDPMYDQVFHFFQQWRTSAPLSSRQQSKDTASRGRGRCQPVG
jgi:hypothetical protein